MACSNGHCQQGCAPEPSCSSFPRARSGNPGDRAIQEYRIASSCASSLPFVHRDVGSHTYVLGPCLRGDDVPYFKLICIPTRSSFQVAIGCTWLIADRQLSWISNSSQPMQIPSRAIECPHPGAKPPASCT